MRRQSQVYFIDVSAPHPTNYFWFDILGRCDVIHSRPHVRDNNSPYWSRQHWCNGIIAKTVESSMRHLHDISWAMPWLSQALTKPNQQLNHDQCSPKGIGSMFATARSGKLTQDFEKRFARTRRELLELERWMRKCVGRIWESAEIRCCWPSRKREFSGHCTSLGSHCVSDWQRDAERPSICELFPLAANRDDSGWKHDIWHINRECRPAQAWSWANWHPNRWWPASKTAPDDARETQGRLAELLLDLAAPWSVLPTFP